MRVVIATDAWHPQINGVVTTLATIKEKLENRGHQILTVTPDQFTTLPCPTYAEIRLALRPGPKVAQLLNHFQPDAIHVATEGPIGLAVRAYCLKRGLQFTTSLHTRFPEYLRLRLPVPLSLGYAFLRWFHAPAVHTMVVVPSLQRELQRREFQHLVIWPRGVNLELFRPRKRGYLEGKRPVFMYVGRVAVEKNVEAFLNLSLPGAKYVVGDGPRLETLKKNYPDTCFTGYKTGVALARHVAAADVFVFPSQTDTFGLVILEAMACGVPVAAYPVQGPVDLIHNGENGYVDEDLGKAAFNCLSVDREKCRQFAMSYSWDTCANRFLDNLAPV